MKGRLQVEYPNFDFDYLKIRKYTDKLSSDLDKRGYLFYLKSLILKKINSEKNHDKTASDYQLLYKINKDIESVNQFIQEEFNRAFNDPKTTADTESLFTVKGQPDFNPIPEAEKKSVGGTLTDSLNWLHKETENMLQSHKQNMLINSINRLSQTLSQSNKQKSEPIPNAQPEKDKTAKSEKPTNKGGRPKGTKSKGIAERNENIRKLEGYWRKQDLKGIPLYTQLQSEFRKKGQELAISTIKDICKFRNE